MDGKGVTWQLESAWPIAPLWVIVGSVITIALLAALHWRWRIQSDVLAEEGRWYRGVILWSFRAFAIVVLAWMLGGWRLARFETDLPDLVMLLDNSASMQLAASDSASTNEQRRWDAAKSFLLTRDGDSLKRLANDYRLRAFLVANDRLLLPTQWDEMFARIQSEEAQGTESRLGDHLEAIVRSQRGRSTAAMVLISDGVVTNGQSLENAAREIAGSRIPVFAVRVGNTDPPPQVAITELVADPTAMVGDTVSVMARISWTGAAGEALRVKLMDQATESVLAEQTIAGSDRGATVSVLNFLATETGVRQLRVEVAPLVGEVTLEDNQEQVVVEVRDESFRVLLVQGGPSYEFRFLKHLLERATNRAGTRPLVELTSVLQRGDARYADQDRSASRLPPVDTETLEGLDLIILSDCDPKALGTVFQEKIVDLVSRVGVSLMIIAGPNHLPQGLAGTPLERLLPLDPEEVVSGGSAAAIRWQLTNLGQTMPMLNLGGSTDLWPSMPPIYWLASAGQLRPGARVFLETTLGSATGPGKPILVGQFVGSGQVTMQLTDETFRLRAIDTRSEVYDRYWLQLVRGLAQRRDLVGADEASVDVRGSSFLAADDVPFEVRLGSNLAAIAGDQTTVVVTAADGQEQTFNARASATARGVYEGQIRGLAAGQYRVVLASPVAVGDPPSDLFNIKNRSSETDQAIADRAALSNLGQRTGGKMLDFEEGFGRLVELLPEGRSIQIRPLEKLPIWNHWLTALLLLGSLSGEWILRRRWGGV